MANNVANVPYSFTTTLTSFKAAAGAVPKTGPLMIAQIYWLAPASAGDKFIIQNEFGQVIATAIATAATVTTGYYLINFFPSLRSRDWKITQMDSGTLYIYSGASTIGTLNGNLSLTGDLSVSGKFSVVNPHETAFMSGLYGEADVSSAAHLTVVTGVSSLAYQFGSGIVDSLLGVFGQAEIDSGTVGHIAGVEAGLVFDGGTVTTRSATLYADSPIFGGGSTPHHYGLYIEDQTNGGASNPDPWAIYVVGGRTALATPNSAPTDGNLQNGQVSFYLNEAGNQLKVRVKYSDGTLKTATISLT